MYVKNWSLLVSLVLEFSSKTSPPTESKQVKFHSYHHLLMYYYYTFLIGNMRKAANREKIHQQTMVPLKFDLLSFGWRRFGEQCRHEADVD